ncbi:hypothetical protein M2326_001147 [Flavobacterium sp. 7A]|nr:hypothetical protein [Flavobacterium sp. 7A]
MYFVQVSTLYFKITKPVDSILKIDSDKVHDSVKITSQSRIK